MTLSLDKPGVYFSVRMPIDDLQPVHQSQAHARRRSASRNDIEILLELLQDAGGA